MHIDYYIFLKKNPFNVLHLVLHWCHLVNQETLRNEIIVVRKIFQKNRLIEI